MKSEKKFLTRKRKFQEESTKDSSDEYILNKKSKSSSDTNSDEHNLKINKKFNINEPIEEFNEKNTTNINIPEGNISLEEYNIRIKKTLEDEINKFSKEPKELINFQKLIKNNEYDWDPFIFMKYLLDFLYEFNKFKEDYTYYIYNNLKPLSNDKQFIEANKNIAYNNKNELFFKSFNEFSNFRWTKFISAAEKYNIKSLQEYKDSINFGGQNLSQLLKNIISNHFRNIKIQLIFRIEQKSKMIN